MAFCHYHGCWSRYRASKIQFVDRGVVVRVERSNPIQLNSQESHHLSHLGHLDKRVEFGNRLTGLLILIRMDLDLLPGSGSGLLFRIWNFCLLFD